MALDKTMLENSIKNVFSTMQSKGSSVTDLDFCKGLTDSIKDYIATGVVNTIDSGTVSEGVLTATGVGTLNLNYSLMQTLLSTACETMKTMQEGADDYLAKAIGDGLDAMTSQVDTVETTVNGTASTSSSSTPIVNAKAKGNITCISTNLIQGLKDCFQDMKSKHSVEGYDGDSDFADKLSSLVHTYFTSGIISTHGTGEISGSVGTGNIS